MSVSPKNLIQGESRAYKPTKEDLAVDSEAVEARFAARQAQEAQARTEQEGVHVRGEMSGVEIQIDPAMLQQLVQNKNARLIAMMVNENALIEAALDQQRRISNDWQAKYEALKQSLIE